MSDIGDNRQDPNSACDRAASIDTANFAGCTVCTRSFRQTLHSVAAWIGFADTVSRGDFDSGVILDVKSLVLKHRPSSDGVSQLVFRAVCFMQVDQLRFN